MISHGLSFAGFISERANAVAEALLEVTDRRAATIKTAAVRNIYDKLRAMAKPQVEAAVPELGVILERHLD